MKVEYHIITKTMEDGKEVEVDRWKQEVPSSREARTEESGEVSRTYKLMRFVTVLIYTFLSAPLTLMMARVVEASSIIITLISIAMGLISIVSTYGIEHTYNALALANEKKLSDKEREKESYYLSALSAYLGIVVFIFCFSGLLFGSTEKGLEDVKVGIFLNAILMVVMLIIGWLAQKLYKEVSEKLFDSSFGMVVKRIVGKSKIETHHWIGILVVIITFMMIIILLQWSIIVHK